MTRKVTKNPRARFYSNRIRARNDAITYGCDFSECVRNVSKSVSEKPLTALWSQGVTLMTQTTQYARAYMRTQARARTRVCVACVARVISCFLLIYQIDRNIKNNTDLALVTQKTS
nr:MAG TPA: hypothetical protein [Caudoviricetes sp.]